MAGAVAGAVKAPRLRETMGLKCALSMKDEAVRVEARVLMLAKKAAGNW